MRILCPRCGANCQLCKKVHKALNEDNPAYYKIPDDQFLIAQELFLFSLSDEGREELEKFVIPNYSKGRMSIKVNSIPTEESILLSHTIKNMLETFCFDTGLQFNLTGTLYLNNLRKNYIFESLVEGFIIAFLSIIGVMFIAFWSVKYGIVSILPNLLPIIYIFGIMGWSGISLNVSTVMVASIALGIVVDDTVHFILRFRKEFNSINDSIHEVLNKTIVSVGRAIILTSVINIAAFSIALLSGFKPTRAFGLLLSLTLFFALIGDIIVLPASIMAGRKYFLNRCSS